MNQLGLLGAAAPPRVVPVPVSDSDKRIARALPPNVRLGTSSWTFPGWSDILWRGTPSQGVLAEHGLPAYAHNPLFRTVGVDRTFYRPVDVDTYASWGAQVPPDFRFLVKAHDHVTTARFPRHPRFGERAGAVNPRFLDPEYATEAVIRPTIEGLSDRLGVLLFQFPPHDPTDLGETPRAFAIRLYRFLRALPAEVPYAVEVRNPWVLGRDYAGALRESGVSHCFNVQTGMPSLAEQRHIVGTHSPLRVVRWMLPPGVAYEQARARYAPFNALAAPQPSIRDTIAEWMATADDTLKPGFVIVNNKAEGCSPLSVRALATRITGT